GPRHPRRGPGAASDDAARPDPQRPWYPRVLARPTTVRANAFHDAVDLGVGQVGIDRKGEALREGSLRDGELPRPHAQPLLIIGEKVERLEVDAGSDALLSERGG